MPHPSSSRAYTQGAIYEGHNPTFESGLPNSHRRPLQTTSYTQPTFENSTSFRPITRIEVSSSPPLTKEEKDKVKLFLALVLNLVDDQKKKSGGSRDNSSGSARKKNESPKKIGFGNHVISSPYVPSVNSALDSKKSSADVGVTIQRLETTLNQLEHHNQRLSHENSQLKLKLRGIEDISGLKEEENIVMIERAATLLESTNSPFFKANTSLRKMVAQKAKLKGNQINYGDHVKEKIDKNEKFSEMVEQIRALQDENSILRHKNQTYESEINELYHRIDKFGTLEISVAELIQENERLRQILVKITGQIHQNF